VLKDYFTEPDYSKLMNYRNPLTTVVYDKNKTPIFYLYDKQFRFYTRANDVPNWVRELIFDERFISIFQSRFAKDYDFYNNSVREAYLNYVLKDEIYFYDNSLLSRIQMRRIRKYYAGNNFDELIFNNLKFSKSVYGLTTACYVFFGKSIQTLSIKELLFCIANIDFYGDSDEFDLEKMRERYLDLVELVRTTPKYKTILKDSLQSPELEIRLNKSIDFENSDGQLTGLKAGISKHLMKYYLKDYLITQMRYINLMTGGYNINAEYDMEYLIKILNKLGIKATENSNKICIVYYNYQGTNRLLGILNLPFGGEIIERLAELEKSEKYANAPVTFMIMPIMRYSYIELYEKRKNGIIPLVK